MTLECESFFTCNYPDDFKTLYKHQGGNGPYPGTHVNQIESDREGEEGFHELVLDDSAGITKAYEAVTQYLGFGFIEAGKTMGLAPYGKKDDKNRYYYDEEKPANKRHVDVIPYTDEELGYLLFTNDRGDCHIDPTGWFGAGNF